MPIDWYHQPADPPAPSKSDRLNDLIDRVDAFYPNPRPTAGWVPDNVPWARWSTGGNEPVSSSVRARSYPQQWTTIVTDRYVVGPPQSAQANTLPPEDEVLISGPSGVAPSGEPGPESFVRLGGNLIGRLIDVRRVETPHGSVEFRLRVRTER